MNHGYVTLDEVFGAAAARAAALAPETSGYLALAIGDATARLPLTIEERAVMLTTEGSVSLARRGDPLPPKQAARGLRDLVARLLAVSAGTMPGLAATARPRDESERGVDAVVEELEAALIPVNRAAARRALGRLARETLKAKELGKLAPTAPRLAAPAREERAKSAPAPALPDIAKVPVRDAAPARDTAPAHDAMLAHAPAPKIEPAKGATPEAEPAIEPAPVSAPEAALAGELPQTCAPDAAETRAPACVAEIRAEGLPALAFATAPSPAPGLTVPSPDHAVFLAAEEPVTAPHRLLEPTPTAFGMPAVEIIDPTSSNLLDVGVPTTLDVVTAMEFSPTPSDALTLPRTQLAPKAPELPEVSSPAADVLAPHARELAALSPLPLPVLAPTPYALLAVAPPPPTAHAETPPLPRARPVTQPLPAAPLLAAPARAVPTRADVLLARFGASCDEDASVREAAACLKKFAGLDPTPPPPSLYTRPSARAPALPRSSRRDPTQLVELVEVAPAPPASTKRSAFGVGTAVVFGVLLGAFAVAHARPDLVAVLTARLLASSGEPAHPARPATDTAAR